MPLPRNITAAAATSPYDQKLAAANAVNEKWEGVRLRLPAVVPYARLHVVPYGEYAVHVQVMNGFQIRTDLKRREFRFDGLYKAWFKAFDTVKDARAYAETLPLQLGDERP